MAGGLTAVLERAQRLGFIGPGPLTGQLDHARAFARLIEPPVGPFLDLGAGGGIPGLVLAIAWPDCEAALLDAGERRGAHLRQAVDELGLEGRTQVIVARAEDAARDPRWRGHFDLVVARAFAAPAVTAECAVGFLGAGGRLVVSEPPEHTEARWNLDGLAQLGFGAPRLATGAGATAAALDHLGPTADRWPRRAGVPERRPLWR